MLDFPKITSKEILKVKKCSRERGGEMMMIKPGAMETDSAEASSVIFFCQRKKERKTGHAEKDD